MKLIVQKNCRAEETDRLDKHRHDSVQLEISLRAVYFKTV